MTTINSSIWEINRIDAHNKKEERKDIKEVLENSYS